MKVSSPPKEAMKMSTVIKQKNTRTHFKLSDLSQYSEQQSNYQEFKTSKLGLQPFTLMDINSGLDRRMMTSLHRFLQMSKDVIWTSTHFCRCLSLILEDVAGIRMQVQPIEHSEDESLTKYMPYLNNDYICASQLAAIFDELRTLASYVSECRKLCRSVHRKLPELKAKMLPQDKVLDKVDYILSKIFDSIRMACMGGIHHSDISLSENIALLRFHLRSFLKSYNYQPPLPPVPSVDNEQSEELRVVPQIIEEIGVEDTDKEVETGSEQVDVVIEVEEEVDVDEILRQEALRQQQQQQQQQQEEAERLAAQEKSSQDLAQSQADIYVEMEIHVMEQIICEVLENVAIECYYEYNASDYLAATFQEEILEHIEDENEEENSLEHQIGPETELSASADQFIMLSLASANNKKLLGSFFRNMCMQIPNNSSLNRDDGEVNAVSKVPTYSNPRIRGGTDRNDYSSIDSYFIYKDDVLSPDHSTTLSTLTRDIIPLPSEFGNEEGKEMMNENNGNEFENDFLIIRPLTARNTRIRTFSRVGRDGSKLGNRNTRASIQQAMMDKIAKSHADISFSDSIMTDDTSKKVGVNIDSPNHDTEESIRNPDLVLDIPVFDDLFASNKSPKRYSKSSPSKYEFNTISQQEMEQLRVSPTSPIHLPKICVSPIDYSNSTKSVKPEESFGFVPPEMNVSERKVRPCTAFSVKGGYEEDVLSVRLPPRIHTHTPIDTQPHRNSILASREKSANQKEGLKNNMTIGFQMTRDALLASNEMNNQEFDLFSKTYNNNTNDKANQFFQSIELKPASPIIVTAKAPIEPEFNMIPTAVKCSISMSNPMSRKFSQLPPHHPSPPQHQKSPRHPMNTRSFISPNKTRTLTKFLKQQDEFHHESTSLVSSDLTLNLGSDINIGSEVI